MSRQRVWASAAHKAAREVKGKEGEGKFRTHALRLPTLIKQAGLAQALAFVSSRDDQGKLLVKKLGEALAHADLTRAALEEPLSQYVALSRDAIAASVWFRRFAQSELEGEGV